MTSSLIKMADQDKDKEQKILFNFLKYYQLDQHFERLLNERVTRVQHLKNTRPETLLKLGFSEAEVDRLKTKLSQNFGDGALGKVKSTWKKDKFNKDTEDWERTRVRLRSNPAQLDDEDPYENPYVAEPHEVLIESRNVKIGEPLGEGSYGKVYRGLWRNKNTGVNLPVAIKMIELNEVGTLIREYQSLVKIRHPHVVTMFGLSIDYQPMLIEELAPLGALVDFLKKHGSLVHLEQMHQYCVQVADGMSYLSRHKIVHRDLAARNVLLSNKDTTKICDFGMARVIEESEAMMSLNVASRRIPYAWSALEIITEGHFSTFSDVWSFGVTMWEIFSLGKEPWQGLSLTDVRDHLVQNNRLARPKLCPTDIYNKVMVLCWNPKPGQRPPFNEIKLSLSKTTVQKLVAVRDLDAAEDGAMELKQGEVIYIASRDQDQYYGVSESGSVGYVKQVHVTRDLTQAITSVQPLQEAVAQSQKHAMQDHAAQSEFTYSTDVAEHAYEEVPGPMRNPLPPPPSQQYDTQPPFNPRYDTPRRLYYNQNPGAYEETYQYMGTSDEYQGFQDQDPVTVQPLGAAAQDPPIPKPRRKSASPRVGPLPAAPSEPPQTSPSPASPYIVMHSEDVVRRQMESETGLVDDGDGDTLPAPLSVGSNNLMTASVGSTASQTGGYVTINQQQMGEMAQQYRAGGSDRSGDLAQGISQLSVSDHQKVTQPVESLYSDEFYEGGGRQLHPPRGSASHSSASSRGPSMSPKRQSQELEGSGALSYATAGPSSSKANVQLQFAEQIATIQSQLTNVTAQDCEVALQQAHGDTNGAIVLLQVDMLMKMNFQYITPEDCRAALAHCQNKVDRAAEWLLEKSNEIATRRV